MLWPKAGLPELKPRRYCSYTGVEVERQERMTACCGEQEEDREILHAAMKSGGVLTADACLSVMTRLPNPAESWPLPRTERQVRARGDWLGAKLAGMARGGAESV